VPTAAYPRVRAVVFDVGETLLDEGTEYGTWADWLGAPRHTFSAMFGAVIARGEDYRQTFQHFRPGFDLPTERLRREEADLAEHFNEGDLLPGRSPKPGEAEAARVPDRGRREPDDSGGAAASRAQPAGRLHRASAGWGVEKPSAEFFARIVEECGCPPEEIAYVGDRFDNDIRPALDTGMVAGSPPTPDARW